MFVRFGGCDYRCKMCDSMHAVDPRAVQKHATWMTAAEIASILKQRADETGVKWVTFSGGNPCMHKLDYLVQLLQEMGIYINVETQGTIWQDWLIGCAVITVSPKSMGMGEKFNKERYEIFLRHLRGHRPLCVKVVVFSAADLEFALWVKDITDSIAEEWAPGFVTYYLSLGNPYPPQLNDDLELQDPPILFRANSVDGGVPIETTLADTLLSIYKDLSEEVLLDRRLKDFRFLPQLHVLVYGNETGR
jgi:7-carboxy-7-deazaguanine synthase